MRQAVRRVALPALAVLYGLLLLWQTMATPLRPFDENLWYLRSCRWPAECRPYGGWLYNAAVDVPAVNRWAYGAAQRLSRLTELPCPRADYSKSHAQNILEGRLPPWQGVMVMRSVNVAAYLATLALLWLTARMALGCSVGTARASAWAALAVVPLAFSKIQVFDVVARAGPDALLAFAMAAMLAAWTYWHLRAEATSLKVVLYLGALAGLATGAKLNGALMVLALVGYLVAYCRGRDRLVKPLAAIGVSLVAFSLLNPVVFMGGVPPYQPLLDMIQRRLHIIGMRQEWTGPMGWLEFTRTAVPAWPVLPLFAAGLVAARRAQWFRPVAWWCALLTLGTFFSINRPVPAYLGPLELGLYFPGSLCLVWLMGRRSERDALDALALVCRRKMGVELGGREVGVPEPRLDGGKGDPRAGSRDGKGVPERVKAQPL